jgi:hypothetical protein
VPDPSVPTERVPRHHLPAAPLGLAATTSASDPVVDCTEADRPLGDGLPAQKRSAEQQRTTIASSSSAGRPPTTHERVPRHHLLVGI